MLMSTPSPARLGHTRQVALEGQLAEADAAQLELPHVAAGPPARPTAVALPDLELRLPQALRDRRFSCHGASYLLRAKGIPMPASKACAWSSVGADVVMVMFMPMVPSTFW